MLQQKSVVTLASFLFLSEGKWCVKLRGVERVRFVCLNKGARQGHILYLFILGLFNKDI
jgi:hypothetical protein